MKEINLTVKDITTDITKEIDGYSEIYVERVYGDLFFMKNGSSLEDAIKIEDNTTYQLNNITQIHNVHGKKAKSFFTLKGYLK